MTKELPDKPGMWRLYDGHDQWAEVSRGYVTRSFADLDDENTALQSQVRTLAEALRSARLSAESAGLRHTVDTIDAALAKVEVKP